MAMGRTRAVDLNSTSRISKETNVDQHKLIGINKAVHNVKRIDS